MISVIIPVYNEQNNIPKIINMIDTYSYVEFIIVDAGSTDSSRQLLREKKINFLTSDKGRAIQLNYGAEKASGSILLFLHADCDINEQHFQKIIETIDKGFAGGAFYTKTKSYKNWFWDIIYSFADIQSFYNKNPYGDQGIFCTSRAFNFIKGYDESLPVFEDYDFSRRLRNYGKTTLTGPRIIVSGRRYIKWGIIKSIVIMKGLKLAFRLGVSPQKLIKFYRSVN
ncbi:MAG: glycosyltransferase family 2 protein [bacterium]|nr:glycosyltransferase family 2 protein [bacterium]